MASSETKVDMALGVVIKQGTITVNSQRVTQESTTLPEGVTRIEGGLRIPGAAWLDTVEDAVFTIHPVLENVLNPEPYAEVRGKAGWRMYLMAPMESTGDATYDRRRNKAPVSYLHTYQDPGRGPYLELQVNEGRVSVAVH